MLRGALRDYFDLMCIEERTELDVVIGLQLYQERFRPSTPDQHVRRILLALGYFGDVDDDPTLPATRDEIEQYWTDRQRAVIRALEL